MIFRHAPHLVRATEALADIIWARACPLADALPAEEAGFRHLSAGLIAKLPLVTEGPWCATCGFPFCGALSGPARCVHCETLSPAYESGRTVMLAKGPGRALLHEFKYHDGGYLAGDLARLAARAPGYSDRLAGAVLVPVPLHIGREAARGYNQSALLADALARLAPGATRRDALTRVRDTPSQTRLDREARRKNMRDAFAATPAASLEPGRLHVIVDDVFTTGATVNAAAEALLAAGVSRVAVATLAHG